MQELGATELFLLRAKRRMEPAGEECGTQYNEASACPVCGGGADQITPLFMNGRRIPNSLDYFIDRLVSASTPSIRIREADVLAGTSPV